MALDQFINQSIKLSIADTIGRAVRHAAAEQSKRPGAVCSDNLSVESMILM